MKTIPAALDAMKAAAKDPPNTDIRLRARQVAQNLWQQEAVGEGHRMQPPSYARKVVASPDGKRFFTRGEDHVGARDAETDHEVAGLAARRPTLDARAFTRRPAHCLHGRRGHDPDHNAADGTELRRFSNIDPAAAASAPTGAPPF